MRHGERCDFAFGRSWVNKSFDKGGQYTQLDLNLPVSMIPRDNHKDFTKDSPLTEIGKFQARATGDAFKRAGVNIQHVFVSPALRCVQTAQGVVDGMGNNAQLNIEPSAFEWLGWYKDLMPKWLSPQHLKDNGFSINVEHKPAVQVRDLNVEETTDDYYNRCFKLAEHITARCGAEGGDILIVAHAGSLDTFTRRLMGKGPRSKEGMHSILGSLSYCCLCCVVDRDGAWTLEEPPIPTMQNFDWNILK